MLRRTTSGIGQQRYGQAAPYRAPADGSRASTGMSQDRASAYI
jgi:hypothetical protein